VNVIEPLLLQCRHQPDALALCAPGTPLNIVSYGRLEKLINTMAARALSLGLARGNVVAVVLGDVIVHAALTLALARLGIVTLSARSVDFPASLRLDAIITEQAAPRAGAVRVIPFDLGWMEGDGRPLANPPAVGPDDLCRITLTSGTTGEPKTIGLTHRQVAERIARHQYIFGPAASRCARSFCDLGLTINLGFLYLLDMLWRGGVFMFRGVNAEVTLQAFGLYRIESMIMSPAVLAEFLGYYERDPTHQDNMQLALSGGSVVSPALADRFRSRVCTNLVSFYGATEVHGVAAARVQAIQHIPGAAGYLLPGVTVEAVDHSGRVLPGGQEGLLRTRGPCNIAGYMNDDDATRSVFRDGWFYSGDIGTVREDSLLIVTGREKSIVNLGGDKINPELIERALNAFAPVADAAVFAIPNPLGIDELHAAVVWRGPADDAGLRMHCQSHLAPAFRPARYIAVANIPRNDAGKIDRRRLPDCATSRQ
jgi:acyl-coenzyme A synthetase/AMP-(fatty) acid ligase